MESSTFPQSPSQTVGPFFHDALISGKSGHLVQDQALGERIRVTGRVLDGDGAAVDDAMLEIWQPDANGIFPHPADPRAEHGDPHFRGFGRVDSAEAGRYEFDTIKPGVPVDSPEGHTPFIYITVFSRGLLVHVITRMYFSDEPTDSDPILIGIDPTRRHTLIARREDSTGPPTYHFDFRLQGEDETVFFDL